MMMGATNMLPDLDAPISGTFAPVPVIDASEISNAVLFLASDEGRCITGTPSYVSAPSAVSAPRATSASLSRCCPVNPAGCAASHTIAVA